MLCGILFKTSYHTKTNRTKFEQSLELLNHRGPDETGILYSDDYAFGHKRLSIRDITNGKQPMSILNHHLIYNGEIYNTDELIDNLKKNNVPIESYSDTLVLLKSLILDFHKTLNEINGIFAFVYTNNNTVYAVRDNVGVKPLYYTIYNGDIIIASEIKAIINYTNERIIDKKGLLELLGLGPSHSPGNTYYKDIYELKPGHYLKYDKNGLEIKEYYNVTAKEYIYSKEDTISLVKYLLTDSSIRQLVSDVPLATFLSGGLDSSILTAIIANAKADLNTYSIDYEDNKLDYKTNKYEVSRDEDYINYLVNKYKLVHHTITVDTNTVFDYLKSAVVLKDAPGYTDIDSSMLYLAKKIKQKHTVGISGECADELFGGYPWFYNEQNCEMFPWITNLDYRQSLINPLLDLNIKDYVKQKYDEIISEAPINKNDTKEIIKERQMSYINIKYFMTNLLERKDKMTMGASLEVRVPFADKRIVDLAYNIPFKYKYFNNQEKALLREAFKDILPIEILNRKKSPYPKARSKKYHEIIKSKLKEILDGDTILNTIFNHDKLLELINSEELETPWYGQLMRIDQLMAYLYQIDYWFKEYKLELEL